MEAVAFGNSKDSLLLHGTLALNRVLKIMGERRHLYTNWLVRWDLDVNRDSVIDLSNLDAQQEWLRDEDGDTDLVIEWLQWCRKFATKDAEVVQLRKPPWQHVQWWDEDTKTWQPLGNGVLTPPLRRQASLGLAAHRRQATCLRRQARMEDGDSCSQPATNPQPSRRRWISQTRSKQGAWNT